MTDRSDHSDPHTSNSPMASQGRKPPMRTGEILIWILLWIFILYPLGFVIIALALGAMFGDASGIPVLLGWLAYFLFPIIHGLRRARGE